MANRVGEQLGNYRLVRLLGEGGFAEVYLGKHNYLNTQAAIKVLHTQLTGKEKDQFQSEARIVAHLKHPNIVQVLEFGIDGDVPFLIMSYAPHGNLRQRHPHGKQLPLPTILHYMKQITGALQYIHDQKLIHRDIKPLNMLLGANNEVLLSDFGLALIALSSHHESLQGLAGTISYMAPEQLQGKPRLASDQYSLGVVIYEWLSGDLPFRGSFTEIASQHILTPPPPLHDKVPTISPAIEEVVMAALSKDPQQRFESIQAFARAFEQSYQPLLPAPTVDLKSQSFQPSTTIVLTDNVDDISPPNSDQQNAVVIQPASSFVSDGPTKLRSQPARASDPALMKDRQTSPPRVSFPQQQLRRNKHIHIIPFSLIASLLRRRSRPSLLVIVSALMVAVILAIAGLRYYAFQTVPASASASTVTINFAPKVQPFSEIFTLTATPTVQNVDVNRAIIPVKNVTSSLSTSQSGQSTGPLCRHTGCQPIVTQADVDTLVAQMQPGLERQLTQDLQKKVSNTRGSPIGNISFTTVSAVPTPAVGQQRNTVTVTLIEQGSVYYIVNADAQSVARQALARKVHLFGVNYILFSNTVIVGPPVVQNVNSAANSVTIAVAAGGDGVYQFPPSELQAIWANLVGKTVKAAQAFLANQPGIDPKTIAIHFKQGGGNTLPSDIKRITIVPIDASNLPPVQLKTMPTPTQGNRI